MEVTRHTRERRPAEPARWLRGTVIAAVHRLPERSVRRRRQSRAVGLGRVCVLARPRLDRRRGRRDLRGAPDTQQTRGDESDARHCPAFAYFLASLDSLVSRHVA